MTPPRPLVWATLFGAGVGFEVWEVSHDGYPLSRLVRDVAHIDHPAGRALFLVGWGWFAAWFAAHIIGGDLTSYGRVHS